MAVDYQGGAATRVTLAGDGFGTPDHDVLEAGAFALEVVAVGDELQLEVTRGRPQPEQVLRLLYRDRVIDRTGEGDGRLAIVVEGNSATDTAVYTAGVRHRLLYERTYDPAGPVVIWFGFNPFLKELAGDPAERIARQSFRNVVGMATNHFGRVGTLTILNLFTRRSDASADITADGADALTSNELIERSIADADAVVAAWGGDAGETHLPQVESLWSLVRGHGLRLLAPAKGGQPMMTSTWPQQPRHPSRIGYKHVGLVPIPDRWIETFEVADAA